MTSVWGKTNGSTIVSSTPASSFSAKDTITAVPEEEKDIFEHLPRVQKVQLDGLTLLQIMKHCHDCVPKCVTGSLLGFDVQESQILEVTHSFPSPELDSDDTTKSNAAAEEAAEEYQIEMMNNLSEVNVDNNKVGWYQSAVLGSFCSASLIEYQFQYQEQLGPNTICLIYDPSQTKQGNLSLKAFRLSADFYRLYQKGNLTREKYVWVSV